MPVKSVVDIPDFPFKSFSEFQNAYKNGQVAVWTRRNFGVAWEYSDLYSKIWQVVLFGFALYASIAFAYFAYRNNDYRLLLGIPAAVAGLLCSSSNFNAISGCIPMMLMVIGAVVTPFAGIEYGIIGLTAFVSWFASSIGQQSAGETVRQAMVDSEETFLKLWASRIITGLVYDDPDSSGD